MYPTLSTISWCLLLTLCLSFTSCTDLVAPNNFQVQFQTSVAIEDGTFVLDVNRTWAPIGVDHFYTLIQSDTHYYNNNGFFRVVPGSFVQFGINGDPTISAEWNETILDDPVIVSNLEGYVTYAMDIEPNSRTTQLFINYGNNSYLDSSGFAPFARVIKGMSVVQGIFAEYGEQPAQALIYSEGNVYLENDFPKTDYIISVTIVSNVTSTPDSPNNAAVVGISAGAAVLVLCICLVLIGLIVRSIHVSRKNAKKIDQEFDVEFDENDLKVEVDKDVWA